MSEFVSFSLRSILIPLSRMRKRLSLEHQNLLGRYFQKSLQLPTLPKIEKSLPEIAILPQSTTLPKLERIGDAFGQPSKGSFEPSNVILQRQAADVLARAEAILTTLHEESSLLAIAKRWQEEELKHAETSLREAKSLYTGARMQDALLRAQEAERLLSLATYDAYLRLAKAQREVLSQALSKSLQEMGYSLKRFADERGIALWATQEERKIAIVVNNRGKMQMMQMDMAGFNGISCHIESEELISALRRNGVEVCREHSTLHARREGGALILAAAGIAKKSEKNEAEALLDTVTQKQTLNGQRVTTEQTSLQKTDSPQSNYERAKAWLWIQKQRIG